MTRLIKIIKLVFNNLEKMLLFNSVPPFINSFIDLLYQINVRKVCENNVGLGNFLLFPREQVSQPGLEHARRALLCR